MVKTRESILRYDLGDMSFKDVLISVEILDNLVERDWNSDQHKRALMLMELRDFTVEWLLKKYILPGD